jgi:ABC-type amino acid transport substrate-binding protein
VSGVERLRTLVRTGACDAALVPAVEAGRFVAGSRASLGPVVGRIERGKGLVVAVPRGGTVDATAVDRELERLRRDGTLGRLARSWLGLDPASLPVLR